MAVPSTAEVVIVGGGVIGASTAYYLTRMGCRDVLVLERDALAAGSTGRSVGGVRAQFSTETNVRIMLFSIDVFERFQEEFGVDIGFRQYGYLFLLHAPEQVEVFRRNVRMQRRLGFDVLELSPEEARERFIPQLNTEGILGATWCAREGYADPTSTANGFAGRAREQGATIRVGVDVTGIRVSGDRVDTLIYDDMAERLAALEVDVALLPINGRDYWREQANLVGNITYREAADLTAAAGVRLVVPMHYEMFGRNRERPGSFVDYLRETYPHLGAHVFGRYGRLVYTRPDGPRPA